MKNDMTHKIGRIVTWLCGLSSLVLLLLWVTMAISCRLGLGHWPEPMIENCTGRNYDMLNTTFILWGHFALFLAGPVVLLGLIVGFSDRLNRCRAALYAIGWACLFCVMWLDPTSFTEWWFD